MPLIAVHIKEPTKIGNAMLIKTVTAILVILLSFSWATAEMYQWVSDDGSITFKDTPPPTAQKRKKVKVYNNSDFASPPPYQPKSEGNAPKKVATPPPPATPQKQQHVSNTVEIYVTSWCGYCKQAIRYMNNKGISYVAYDIEKDSSAKQRYEELGGRGVPLTVIGSKKFSGFSPELLETYLRK